MAADKKPIPLDVGPHLFVDDYLIEQSIHLARTTHQPEKLPRPILSKAEPWHQQPLYFQKVLHDPRTSKFRMWYNVKNPGVKPSVCFCYAESDDAVHWTRPNLGLVSVNGSKRNNVIDAPFGHFGLFFVDEGDNCREPARRYKMAYYNAGRRGTGLHVAFSADGFRFKPYSGNPVIQGDAGKRFASGYANVIGDVIDGCWNPLTGQYLLGCKITEGGYPGKPHWLPEGWRRTVGMTVSKDFITWRRPWQIILPDPANGMEEFYGFQPLIRGTLYLGLLRVLRDDLPADPGGPVEGIGWTELISSRDGKNWTRYQDRLIDRNPAPGSWDHAMAWAGNLLAVGDKDYLYFCGYSAGHKVGDRQNGLAILRKNGFVSRDADNKEGVLRTPLVVIHGHRITVNACVRGEMRLRLLDPLGRPIPGFDLQDCSPVQGDSVSLPLRWRGSLATLKNMPVRMEFHLQNTQLYGFDVLE
ncbi:MAG TPA: hypothetical protein VJL29_09175 [Thermoguttaceae bacterium]|nr:hypothetical protein [Thermoguttaceae bacterium]